MVKRRILSEKNQTPDIRRWFGLQVWTSRAHDGKNGCICAHMFQEEITWGCPVAGHSREVYSVAFSPDGKRVVSGSRDNLLKIWHAATGAVVSDPRESYLLTTYWSESTLSSR